MSHKRIAACLLTGVIVAGIGVAVSGYTTFGRWGRQPVVFYVNPSSTYVSASAAESAVRTALDVWTTQSGAAFEYVYGGRVGDTSTAFDGRSVMMFRKASNGGAVASTYCWADSTGLADCDIVFWEGSYKYFAGSSGCSGGVYIEDIATHELGHALGLGHSDRTDATMYPTYSWCSQEWRTLASDDIAGVQALYGKSSTSSTTKNTAPAVTISSPGSGTTVAADTLVLFSGAASDTEDGNLMSQLRWTSSLDGAIGQGGSFHRVLSTGSHVVTATVVDSGGLTASRQITMTVAAPALVSSSPIQLTARGYKVKGVQTADLSWSGTTAARVDIYRNNNRIAVSPNSGSYTDVTGLKGGGSHTYRVCAEGTSTCSANVSVTF